jgi:hypothetical protein
MNENEILEELKRLTIKDNATLDLANFVLFALSYDEIRQTVTNQEIVHIQQLIAVLGEFKNLA